VDASGQLNRIARPRFLDDRSCVRCRRWLVLQPQQRPAQCATFATSVIHDIQSVTVDVWTLNKVLDMRYASDRRLSGGQ